MTGAARAKAWADLEADLMRNDPPVAAYADSTLTVLRLAELRLLGGSGSRLDLAAACKN